MGATSLANATYVVPCEMHITKRFAITLRCNVVFENTEKSRGIHDPHPLIHAKDE